MRIPMMLAVAMAVSAFSLATPAAAADGTYVTASAKTSGSANPPSKPPFKMPWQIGVFQ